MGDFMESNYIKNRLEPQMNYYQTKCSKLRKEYYTISIASIVINAAIPVLSMTTDACPGIKYIIASISALASIFSSVLLLRKTREHWVEYRSTYEKLKRERVLFEAKVGIYQTASENEFILNCENIMDAEHSLWREINSTPQK